MQSCNWNKLPDTVYNITKIKGTYKKIDPAENEKNFARPSEPRSSPCCVHHFRRTPFQATHKPPRAPAWSVPYLL